MHSRHTDRGNVTSACSECTSCCLFSKSVLVCIVRAKGRVWEALCRVGPVRPRVPQCTVLCASLSRVSRAWPCCLIELVGPAATLITWLPEQLINVSKCMSCCLPQFNDITGEPYASVHVTYCHTDRLADQAEIWARSATAWSKYRDHNVTSARCCGRHSA